MQVIHFNYADSYEPESGWVRKSVCNESMISIEHFVKPPYHSSPKHSHPNSQILYVLKGQLIIKTEQEEILLNENDTVFINNNEVHTITNPASETAIGLDIFVPGRSFDFWKNRSK